MSSWHPKKSEDGMDLLGLELSWLLILPQALRLSPSYSYENSVSINWVPAGELWRNGCIRTIATQEAGYLLCSSHPLTLFCSDYFLPSSLPFFLSSPLPYSLLGIGPRALCMQDQACGSLCHRTISPASPPPPVFWRQGLILYPWLFWNSLCRWIRYWPSKDLASQPSFYF